MTEENDHDATPSVITPLYLLNSVREFLTESDVRDCLVRLRSVMFFVKIICCESSSVVRKFNPPRRNAKLIYNMRKKINCTRGATPTLIEIFKLCRRITTMKDDSSPGISSVVMVSNRDNNNPIPYKILHPPSSQRTTTVPYYGQLVDYSPFGNVIQFSAISISHMIYFLLYKATQLP
jgi:hypothetical protein